MSRTIEDCQQQRRTLGAGDCWDGRSMSEEEMRQRVAAARREKKRDMVRLRRRNRERLVTSDWTGEQHRQRQPGPSRFYCYGAHGVFREWRED